jgi:hypothetical protein
MERLLHLVDLALNNRSLFQDPVHFPLVSLPLSVKGNTHVSLFSLLPTENLDEFAGKNIELISIIFDEENSIVKIGRDKKDFSKLPDGNMYYANMTSLQPGKYKCRLVIRNPATGRGAVASASVHVPQNQKRGIKLYPPLLLKQETRAQYLNNPPGVYPLTSREYFPLVDQLPQGTNHLRAAVRCELPETQPADIQLSANLIHSSSGTGEAVPATITILERYHDVDTAIFLLSIQTQELKPGEYYLYLFAADGRSQSRSGTNVAFQVK